MSYNGSGTFLINTAGQPVVSGTVISSTAFNALTADLATGLSTAITKDGQTTVTANIPMSTYKFTGLGVGSAATDSANLSQVQSTVSKLLNTITGTNTITATASPTLLAYATGQMFYFVAAGDNTTAVTLNIDGLGAKAVTRDGSTALISGDIKSGEVVVVVYDGTRFQVVSQVNSAGDATFANVSITSALNVGGVSTFTGLITANGGLNGAHNGTVGATTPNTGSFTTLTTSSTVTLSGGTANGVLYLNGSKVLTSGSALTFDGTTLGVTSGGSTPALRVFGASTSQGQIQFGSVNGYLIQGGADYLGLNFNTNNATRYYISDTGVSVWSVGGSEQMRLTSTGLGIGTASPSNRLDVNGNAQLRASGYLMFLNSDNTNNYYIQNGGATGSGNPVVSFIQGGVGERMRLDSSGNLGIGVTPSAWGSGFKAIEGAYGQAFAYDLNVPTTRVVANAFNDGSWKYKISSFGAGRYDCASGAHQWFTAPSGTAGNAISFTQAMTLDASGNLIVGGTTPLVTAANRGNVTINGSSSSLVALGVSNTATASFYADATVVNLSARTNIPLLLSTNDTERARITSGGDFVVGKTALNLAAAGCELRSVGLGAFTRSGNPPLWVNRLSDDGTLVEFQQDSVTEGTISVSGNTVSYNAFAGSHWSQLQDENKPAILRGTVMESINELCVWPGENNERLPKSKVSDTVGSKKVYGVFMAWDNDWTTTNDMYITAVGAFICRVNGSVTVQEGDLLESNGDGTARVQADDIIRSSTIGKVTSTVKTHQYDDGSYCVPTVLYCG